MRWRGGMVALAALGAAFLFASGAASGRETRGQIRHIVVIYQENHSFDNVLGRFCARSGRCDGAVTGTLPSGSSIRLRRLPDLVPDVGHTGHAQTRAINGGRMNGWPTVSGCSEQKGYQCMTQYRPAQIPNLTRLARHFAISDRTFQMDSVSSWGAHLELVAGTLDGFLADRVPRGDDFADQALGWGCNSGLDTEWRRSPSAPVTLVPTCVPDYSLDSAQYPYGGAYRPTPVKQVPTLMDELDRAGVSWKLYTATEPGENGYGLAICPTFAGCLYTSQRSHQVGRREVLRDARRGRLPNFSIVLPSWPLSQHNADSMAMGDNWMGRVVDAVERSPDWHSTAIVIAYDDCGCFYDHVPPPRHMGIRTPLVLVSPWVKPRYTDSHVAPIASIMAFAERTFDLPSLTRHDAAAYSYRRAFDFHQRPLRPVPMTHTRVSPAEKARILRSGRPPGDT